ncbi:MAG: hypothetical protein IJC16_05070 [Rikenellaceae bacterium]|nr:hypothetical protein [Rikenellaceae bacterium]
MAGESKTKKRIVTSYKNLSDELKEEVKRQYPTGYTDSMLRIDKGPGDFFYAIMLETPDISYLIKVDVKVDDDVPEEEEDKDYYDDEIKGADDLADSPDDGDDE